MKAVFYEEFGGPISVGELDDPTPARHGVVIEVGASGICRSDWHGWMGHDSDITSFPHVPGHELAGTIAAVGADVTGWTEGDRVTVPFVCACGACPECETGNQQVCDHQTQPGFHNWGSFAQYVAIDHADVNLVALPDSMSFVTAASLGCRFATSYRAVVAQGRVAEGEWVAVHGCGGVGLSAIMIAVTRGARVVGVDVDERALSFASNLGAEAIIRADDSSAVASRIQEITGRGAHLSIDALGSADTAANSILGLRKRGRHVQVGLLAGEHYRPPLPMEHVIAKELELLGSHGMQAHRYDEMLAMISAGELEPQRLIGKTLPLEHAPAELEAMGSFSPVGISVIERF
jgi:alcohol dehydrogenase